MQVREAIEFIRKVIRSKAEGQTLEVKTASGGCPSELYDTLSSFSNQDEGGIIVFGVDEKSGYSLTGVYDAQDLQKRVLAQCQEMSPPVRAYFTVCDVDGCCCVVAEIPSVPIGERPVFYRGLGVVRGAFVRVGDSDEVMTPYELYSFEAFRNHIKDDARIVDNAHQELYDQGAIGRYLSAVKQDSENLRVNVTDANILELMGVFKDGRPTLAAHLVFSKYPQAAFFQYSITAVRVAGKTMGEESDGGARFLDNRRITGSIPKMVSEAVAFVQKNSRHETVVDENGRRSDRDEYPIKAVREAIVNAVVHRDYSCHSEGVPVRIEMYDDRLEIVNEGGLFGQVSISTLGRVRPDTRNSVLAGILEMLHETENRYSGIPTIRAECEKAGLPPPEFVSVFGEFKVVLRNSSKEEIRFDRNNAEVAILKFCERPRTRGELLRFTGLTITYMMGTYIQPLVDAGRLKLSIPAKPKSKHQQYYTKGLIGSLSH